MTIEWDHGQLGIVAATGLIASAGSVLIFANAERLLKRRSGCSARLLAAACCGGLGLLSGIVVALILAEPMAEHPLAAIGVSSGLAMAVDVTTRAGWLRLLRAAVSLLSSGIAALSDKAGGNGSDNENQSSE